ncbi:MAG: extensin family protein [Pseudomonadota bacterium]
MELWIRRLGALAVLAAIITLIHLYAPPQHVPWKPLSLERPIGWATGVKLDRLAGQPNTCFGILRSAGVEYQPIDPPENGDPCGLYEALHLERSVTPYSAPVRTTCSLAAALNTWERNVLQPAAQRHLGQGVSRIETYGTFACRRMYNRPGAPWSEHASANAIDISGFTLEDGSRVSVLSDWESGGAKERFLNKIFDGSCRVFRVSLGPDYNAAHADHFHFDMGNGFKCR